LKVWVCSGQTEKLTKSKAFLLNEKCGGTTVSIWKQL